MYKRISLMILFCISIYANSFATDLTKTEKEWIKEHPIINVGAEMKWAPFSFIDESGTYKGLSKDYLDSIAQIAGFKIKYHTGKTWAELLSSIESGELDVLHTIDKTKAREKYIEFTTPYLELSQYIFTKNKNAHLNSLKKLNGLTIAQVKDSHIISFIRKKYSNINIIEKNSVLECLESVESSESVAFIGDNPSTTYLLRKNFITNIHLNRIVKTQTTSKLHIGVKKDYKILATIINKIIKNHMDVPFTQISDKWMKLSEKKNIILTSEEKKWINANPINRIAVMEYWPHDNNGENLHTELLKLINYYSGLNLIPIKFKGWNEGYTKAKKGDDIAGIMGLSWSKEREAFFYYTPVYDFYPVHLIVRKSNNQIHSLKDLNNKTILSQKNSITNQILKNEAPDSKIINVDSLDAMYERFHSDKKVDAMFSYFLKEKLIYKYKLKIVDELYDKYGESAIGINKSYKILSSIINKTFNIIPKHELSFLRNTNGGNTKNKIQLSAKELEYINEHKVIRVCTNPNWEPIEFTKDGIVQGITIDILNIIKDKLGIEYNFIKTSSWEESQKFLKDKKCDILPSATITPDKLKYANFTKPYFTHPFAIITNNNKVLISNFESILSKPILIKKGSALNDKLKKTYPNINIRETSSHLESLKNVMKNNNYYTISTIPVFSYYKNKYDLKNLHIAGSLDLKANLSIAIDNDNSILLSILNKTLQDIPKSTFDLINDKWSTIKIVKNTDWVFLSKIFTITIIIIIAILFYNRKLNAMVKEKTQDINKQKEELVLLMASLDKNVIFSKTDLEGRITHVSKAFCNISGYSQDELIGNSHNIVRHPDMPKSFFNDMWIKLKKEKSFKVEVKNKNKDGSVYWVKSHLQPEYDSNNKHIGYSSIFQDITDKKAVIKFHKEIENTQKDIIFTMGSIGEARSQETGNHVKRVAEYSKLFALKYGLSLKESEILKQASPMHDIGKIAIPDNILNKPGKLNEKERDIMNTHAILGYNMLKNSKEELLKMAAIVALEHHEKWDGTGYPNNLSGEDIHIFGRITAIADVFDALGSDRVYKKAWSDEKIFKLFKEERGKHFDPKLIDIFFENLDEFLNIRDSLQD